MWRRTEEIQTRANLHTLNSEQRKRKRSNEELRTCMKGMQEQEMLEMSLELADCETIAAMDWYSRNRLNLRFVPAPFPPMVSLLASFSVTYCGMFRR